MGEPGVKLPTVDSLLSQWDSLGGSGSRLSADDFIAQYCPNIDADAARQLKQQIAKLQSMNARLSTADFSSSDSQQSNGDAGPLATSLVPGMTLSTGGAYQVDRFLARGGLGEVHVARDLRLGRDVAIKLLQDRRAGSDLDQRRFLREAEITSRLEHPGVVPVYGIGAADEDRAFYAMRLIDGETMRDAIRRHHNSPHDSSVRRLEFQQLLDRFVDVSNAVAYAHSRGVLHRDLKPANVVLGRFGESLVVDWGLAKVAGRDGIASAGESQANTNADVGLATQNGTVMGTLAYMSPEQASGASDQVGPLADIFSLGAMLLEILTGSPPMAPTKEPRSWDDARSGRFATARAVRPETPAALDAICQKAMALDPADRYPSALDLAQDVQRWLADEPVLAWREPWPVRLRRWGSRHRTLLFSGGTGVLVALAALLIATVYLTHAWQAERIAKDRAEIKEREADQQRLAAEQAKNEALENLRLARQTVDRLRQDARLFPLLPAGKSSPLGQQLPPPREHEKWPVQWQDGSARADNGKSIRFRYKVLPCRWHATGPEETVHVFVFRSDGDPQDLFVVTTALTLPAERVLEIYLSRRTSSSVPTKP